MGISISSGSSAKQTTIQQNLAKGKKRVGKSNISQDLDKDFFETHSKSKTQSISKPKNVDLNDPDFNEPDTFAPGSSYHEPTFQVNSFGQPINTSDPGATNGNSNNAAITLDENGLLTNIPNKAGIPQSQDPSNQALRAMITADGASRFAFTGSGPPQVNEQLFNVVEGGLAFQVKDGVSPSAAMRDMINSPPGTYGFECATAISVNSHIKAYSEYQQKFGAAADAKFDADFAGMKMGYWGHSTPRLQLSEAPTQMEGMPKVGEGYYFSNNHADYKGVKEGWTGENAIYAGKAQADGPVDAKTGQPKYKLGEDLYFGHPFGIASEKHIIKSLLSSASGINPGAEGALAKATGSTSSKYTGELASFLGDFKTATRARQQNISQLQSLDNAYTGSPNQKLEKAWGELNALDGSLDQNEQQLSARARGLITRIDKDLQAMGRSGLAQGTKEYQQLLQIKQALQEVVPGEQMITGYKQAPYL
jgi:hypothetical protein